MKKLLILPIFFFIIAPFNSHGQSSSSDAAIKNTIGLGPRLGYYKANNAEEGSFYFGLQSRIRLGPVFGLEGSVEYRGGQKYEYTVAGQTQTYKTSFVPVTGSALLFLPVNENFAPYGIVGLGAYYTIFEADGPISDDYENEFNFGYHLGFGAEFPLSSNTALNFDYRYLFLNPDDNETSTANADYSGNVFTAGLMFYF